MKINPNYIVLDSAFRNRSGFRLVKASTFGYEGDGLGDWLREWRNLDICIIEFRDYCDVYENEDLIRAEMNSLSEAIGFAEQWLDSKIDERVANFEAMMKSLETANATAGTLTWTRREGTFHWIHESEVFQIFENKETGICQITMRGEVIDLIDPSEGGLIEAQDICQYYADTEREDGEEINFEPFVLLESGVL